MSLAPASNALLPVMSVIEMAFATMAPETYLPLLEVVRSLSNYLSAAYMGAQALDLGWGAWGVAVRGEERSMLRNVPLTRSADEVDDMVRQMGVSPGFASAMQHNALVQDAIDRYENYYTFGAVDDEFDYVDPDEEGDHALHFVDPDEEGDSQLHFAADGPKESEHQHHQHLNRARTLKLSKKGKSKKAPKSRRRRRCTCY